MGNQRTQLIDCKQVYSSRQSFETFNYKTNSKVTDQNSNINNKRSLYDAYENSGVLVFAMQDLFEKIQQIQNNDDQRKFEIKLSYIEIYNEVVYDLMSNQQKLMGTQVDDNGLNIHEGKDKQFYIKGVNEIVVNNIDEVLEYIQIGEKNRHYAQTFLNHSSSRSHTLFRLQLFQNRKCEFTNTNIQTSNLLNFVDLAGSEKIQNIARKSVSISQTSCYDQNQNQRLKEGLSINKSLFNLTQVIHLLSQKQQKHIPYRNSTLTKILKSSLSSNSKTTIIVCITPSSSQIEQTLYSLKFGQKAMKIQQSAQVQINEIKSNALQNRINFSNIKNFDNQKKIQEIINEYENKIIQMEQQNQNNKETVDLKKRIIDLQEEAKRLEDAIEILGERSFHTKLIYLQKSKGEQIINFKFAGDVILQTTKQSLYSVQKIIDDKYQKNNELILMANNCRMMFNQIQGELKLCKQENSELKEECDRLESEYQDIINEFAKMKTIQKEIFEITKSKEKMIKYEEQEYDFHQFSDQDIKKIEIHFNKLLVDLKIEKDNRRNLKISASLKSVQSYNEIKSQIQNKSAVLHKSKSPINSAQQKVDLNGIENKKNIGKNNVNLQSKDQFINDENKNKKIVSKLNFQKIEERIDEQKFNINNDELIQKIDMPEYFKEEIALKNETLNHEQQKKTNQKLMIQCNKNVLDQQTQDPYQNWNQKIGNRNIEPIQEEVLKENDPSSLENVSNSIGFDVSPQLYPGYFHFQSKDDKQNKAQQKYFINCMNLQKKIQLKQIEKSENDNQFDQKQLFKNVYQAHNFYNLQKQMTPNNNYQLRNKQSQFNPIILREDIENDHGKSQCEKQIDNLSFVNQKNNLSCENSMGNMKDLLNDQELLNEEMASGDLINDLQINMQKHQYDMFTLDKNNIFQQNNHGNHNPNTNYDQSNSRTFKIQKNSENNQNIFQYNNVKSGKQDNGSKSDKSTQPVLSIFNRKDSFCHDSCSRQNPLLTGAQNSPRKSTLSAFTQNIKSDNTNIYKNYNLNSPAKILNEQISNLQKSPQFQILTKPLLSLKYLQENQSNLQIQNSLKQNYENENIYDQKKSSRQMNKKGPKNVSIDLTIEEDSPQTIHEQNQKSNKECNNNIQTKMNQKKQIIVSEKQLDFKYFEEVKTPDILVQINDDELSNLTGQRSQTAQGIDVFINEDKINQPVVYLNSTQAHYQTNKFNFKTQPILKKENYQIEQQIARSSINGNQKDKNLNERKQEMNLSMLKVTKQNKELSNDLSSSRVNSQSNSHTPMQSCNQSSSFNPALNKEIRRLQKTNKKLMDNNEKYMRIYKDLQNKKYEHSNQSNNIKIQQQQIKQIYYQKEIMSSRNMTSQGNMSERINNESKDSISKQQIDVIDLKQSEYYTNINNQSKTFRQKQPSAQQLLDYQDQPVQINHQSSLSCILASNSKSNNSALFQDSNNQILNQSQTNQLKDQYRKNVNSKNSQSMNSQIQADLNQYQTKKKYESYQITLRQQKQKSVDNNKLKQSVSKLKIQLRKSVSPILSHRNEDQKGNKIGNISNILLQKILDERIKHISSLIENGVFSPTHILDIQKIQKECHNNQQVQFLTEVNQNHKQKQKLIQNFENQDNKKLQNKNQLICQSSLKLASQTSQQSIILRDLSPKYVNYEPVKNQKQKQTKKINLQEKENQNTII